MTDRWHDKAEALDEAWRRRYGTDLSRDGVALALGPAQLETACGDAWPGPDGLVGTSDDERNWGACTLRGLSAEELAVLDGKGIKPTVGPGHVERAAAAMRALADAGMKPPSGQIGDTGIEASGATIHCDSRTVKDANGKPVTIPHFVWFANFASHVDGAEYYLHLLGAAARRVVAKPGTAYELAAAMYARGYYGGFKPHAKYTGADGKEHDGNAENVQAYAAIIEQKLAAIRPGLADWNADVPDPPEATIDLMTGAGVDAALNKLGFARPPLTAKSPTRKRFASIGAYQHGARDVTGRPLDVDGTVGPLTRGALARDLGGAK